MSLPEMTYQEALSHHDPSEVVEVVAKSGAIDRINDFVNLTSLSLRGNGDVTSFAFLAKLPRLAKLYLGDMGLAAIPDEVASLGKLTTLFLGKNPIRDFSLLENLTGLVDLGLEECGLRKIPDPVLKLGALTVLGLYGNSLSSIATLKKLPLLRELYVGSNNITKIPKELLELSHLRKLDVTGNYKLDDRDVLFRMTQLEDLMLTNAHEIPAIGPGLFELTNLRALHVQIHWNAPKDDLGGLEGIGKLGKLEELTIHGASFTRLPDAFSALTSLRSLDLSDNEKLEDIGALRDLLALETLNLDKCGIASIPDSISTLKSLVTLKLSHNKPLRDVGGLRDFPRLEKLNMYSELSTLPETLGTLTSLRVLELSAEAKDVGFLSKLEKLEELYVADCVFDALPSTLRKLKKLTIYRGEEANDDTCLASYAALETLEVTQPSFTLPALRALRSLSVGRIAKRLDLENLASMSDLAELSIHRSDVLREIPKVVGAAKGLRKITIEFMEALTDITALSDLPALRELELSHCDALTELPASLATLTGLERLTLADLDALSSIDVVGELGNLRELDFDSLKIEALPDSLEKLTKLERVKLRSLGELKNIAVLTRIPSLRTLEAEYCGSLRRKEIAAVENAIAGARPAARGGGPTTSYADFMSSGQYQRLTGKEDAKRTYRFPLWFDKPDVLRASIEDFSWTDDYRDEEDSDEAAILTDPDGELHPLAILDFGWEGCDTDGIDSYSEEIFLVDTASAKNPVLIWGHDGSPSVIHDTFDDFLANLRDFKVAGEAEPDDAAEAATGDKTYLEYVEGKSSKFWQIVVAGNEHTVTFGKIGTTGQSKTKTFANASAARADADKLIASKKKKGYAGK